MFKNLFGNNKKSEIQVVRNKVEKLTSLARMLSLSVEEAIPKESTRLQELIDNSESDDWIFFSSSALIAMNVGKIAETHKSLGEKELNNIIKEAMNKVDINYFRAIHDFKKFTSQNGYDPKAHIINIGMWIVWNLEQRKPNNQDKEIVGKIGKLLITQVKEIDEILSEKF